MNISEAAIQAINLLQNFKSEGKIIDYEVEPKVFVTISEQIKPLSLLHISFTLEFPGEDPNERLQYYYLTFLPSYDFARILERGIEGIYKQEVEYEKARDLDRKQAAIDEIELDKIF
jgi:hypothetical protein